MQDINLKNLKTTLSHRGVASSFSNKGQYIISTVKLERGFETVLKVQGQFKEIYCSLFALNSKNAIDNHIAMTRMATSIDTKNWSKEASFNFSPKIIRESAEKMNLQYDPTDLNCKFCTSFLSMSGINYSTGQETLSQMIKNITIVFSAILFLYLIFKYFF